MLSGNIKNKDGNQLEFATVSLFKDSTYINGQISDSVGYFKFNVQKNTTYVLQVDLIGFTREITKVTLSNDSIIVISLNELITNLSAVTVSARNNIIERKIDRMVFNVENSVSASGSTVLDLLSKTPGVRVQNSNISLVGKSSVNVMVNDRMIQISGEELINYLRSMSSEEVKKIEVITNPPAKYDAQGNSGLINIVLKRNFQDGYNGSIRLGGFQASFGSWYTGGTFNYNVKKIRFFSALNYGDGSIAPNETYIINYPNQTWNQQNQRRDYNKYINGRVGLDYLINEKNTISFSYTGGNNNPYLKEDINTNLIKPQSQSIDSSIYTSANTDKQSRFNSGNIYYKTIIDTLGKELEVNADMFNYSNQNVRDYTTSDLNNHGDIIRTQNPIKTLSNQGINLYTMKIDYSMPYKGFNTSFGGKLTFIDIQSDVKFKELINNEYVLDSSRTNNFKYNEKTQAIYGNINKAFGKVEIQLGIRGENTKTTGISSSIYNQKAINNYFRVFPTFYLAYTKNDNNVFAIDYGRRINRPSYSKLNPFRWYNNPYSYTEGNPFLKPSFNNNIELSHVYKNYLTTSIAYSNEANTFDYITLVDTLMNVQRTYPLNFLNVNQYQFSVSYQFLNIKWLESNNQIQLYYIESTSKRSETKPVVKGTGAYFSTDNQAVFNKKKTFLGSVNFWYQFPSVDGIDISSSYYNLNIGFRALLLNKKLQLSLNFTDILKSNKPNYYSLINGIKQQYSSYYDNRQVRLSLSYKFGRNKIKRNEIESSNTDELNRNN